MVSTDGADLERHSCDVWPVAVKWRQQGKEPHRPAVVVRPATPELVARLMRWATESGVPVTPWARLLGTAGRRCRSAAEWPST